MLMQTLRIALVQLAWPGSREPMQATYKRLIAEAAAGGATLICLPEFSLSPYFPGTRDSAGFAWAEDLETGPTAVFFGGLARQHNVQIIASIFEKTPSGDFFDTATIYDETGALTAY